MLVLKYETRREALLVSKTLARTFSILLEIDTNVRAQTISELFRNHLSSQTCSDHDFEAISSKKGFIFGSVDLSDSTDFYLPLIEIPANLELLLLVI